MLALRTLWQEADMNRRPAGVAAVVVAGLRRRPPCSLGADDDAADPDDTTATDTTSIGEADPGDCIVVDMAVSSEKIALLTDLAEEFNGSATPPSRRALRRSCGRAAWRPGSPPR